MKPNLSIALEVQRRNKKKKMPKGGPVESAKQEMRPSPGEADSADMDEVMSGKHKIAEAIMRKRKMMAQGGMVDLDEESKESDNVADEVNMDALGKEQYDDDQISPQPMDSNEHGDDIDADEHSMVSQIRKVMKAKRALR